MLNATMAAAPLNPCADSHQKQALLCSLAYVVQPIYQTSEMYKKDVPHGFDKRRHNASFFSSFQTLIKLCGFYFFFPLNSGTIYESD